MDDERIHAFERDLWIGAEDVYRQRVSKDVQMVLPQEPYVFSGEEAIGAVTNTPRWEKVDFSDMRVSRPEEGMIVIAYHAKASRGEEHYQAYSTSTYRQRRHEEWEVVQHQQTLGLTH